MTLKKHFKSCHRLDERVTFFSVFNSSRQGKLKKQRQQQEQQIFGPIPKLSPFTNASFKKTFNEFEKKNGTIFLNACT